MTLGDDCWYGYRGPADVGALCDSRLVEGRSPLGALSREQILLKMKDFDPEGRYFALNLGANRRGHPFWSRQSHWVGWSERHPNWEIRAV